MLNNLRSSLYHRILIAIFSLILLSCKGTEYGCYEGEVCNLSLESYSVGDELYCTAEVTECNIHCLSPNSCQSLIIYSSAQTTNILCNSTQSCSNTIVRIGDTGEYPLNFKSKHFTNDNPIISTLNCDGENSCTSLKLYFDGTGTDSSDLCTISSTNTNSFMSGYFDCNINGQSQCNLYCGDIYTNECNDAILNCPTNSQCNCNGDGCNTQNITIQYENITTSTTSTPTPDSTKNTGWCILNFIHISFIDLYTVCV